VKSLSLLLLLWPLQAQQYDLVIANGRVLDPESRLEAARTIGIRAGRIEALTEGPLAGRDSIDAAGLVVAPGFIDLHSHGQNLENYRLKAMDGVTAALELEVGVGDVDGWYAERAGKAPIHYGASVGHIPARMALMHDPSRSLVPTGDAAHLAADEEQIVEMKRRVEHGLMRGAVGVGFGIGYTPAASRWEILEMFRVASRFAAPCFVHMRATGQDSVDGLEELIAAAALTGAPLHVVHITSMGLRSTPKLLAMVGEARNRNLDITTELYPYTAAMTELESALFDPGWEQKLGIGYSELQWVATGERLTAETFAKYRRAGGPVIMHMIPPAAVEAAMASPLTMIASDGWIQDGKGHPRGAGTFARVLGHYVRETHTLSLMDAVEKMSLMPARRLETYVPAMRNKGRIRVGADADLTILDPPRVADRATYEQPNLYSTGIRYVLVNGTPVVRDGQLVADAAPGQGVRAALR
jgi:N-acyl-D-aspartate/D-glutamate deacylase